MHVTFASGHLKPPPGTESTDFDLHESKQYMMHVDRLSKTDRKLKGLFRWMLLIMIGLGTGVVGVCIDLAVESFFKLRRHMSVHLFAQGSSAIVQYLSYVGTCMALAGVAGFLVCYVEPLAAGSGIPEVKCYLNGVRLPRVVDLKTLICKAPGVMFSVSAGMPCGKEGPMIHSGACIGGVIAKTGAGPLMRPYRSDVEARDFVAAGAAAGVAAAFGAPLGGVLFAMEEGATFFTPLIMLRTFVCCISATVFVRFVLTGVTGDYPWGTMGAAAPLSFGEFERSNWRIWELPIFALMGVLGGLCGALFNAANTRLTKWRMKHVGGRGTIRYVEVFFVTFVIASITFLMPVLLSGTTDVEKFSPTQSLFRGPGTDNMRDIFHREEDFDTFELFLFGVIYYMLACWCYGLGLPSGLFVPSLLTGATFGRIIGQLLHVPLGLHYNDKTTTDAGVYALMGATAMLSGMARITISLAVILMEASGSVIWALPIFVVTMFSKWAGDFFTIGLYDIHIGLKNIPLLEANPEKEMLVMQAKEVMKPGENLVKFKQIEPVGRILEVLESCEHNGFPVVEDDGHFMGLIKRDTLVQVLWRGKSHGIFQDPGLLEGTFSAAMVPYKDERTNRSLSEIKAALSAEDLPKVVDLLPYVNEGCFTVPETASVTRVYKLFRAMGLRHLPVVTRRGMTAGMITRADLRLIEEEHEHHHGNCFARCLGSL